MEKSLTITLDETLIAHARQHAEKAGKSTDELIADFIVWLDHTASPFNYSEVEWLGKFSDYGIVWTKAAARQANALQVSGTGRAGSVFLGHSQADESAHKSLVNLLASLRKANRSLIEQQNILFFGGSTDEINRTHQYHLSRGLGWTRQVHSTFFKNWFYCKNEDQSERYCGYSFPFVAPSLTHIPAASKGDVITWFSASAGENESEIQKTEKTAEQSNLSWNDIFAAKNSTDFSPQIDLVSLLRFADKEGINASELLEELKEKVAIMQVSDETETDYAKDYKEILGNYLEERYR